MTLVKFIKETKNSTLSADGPGVTVYAVGDKVDLPRDYAVLYAMNGNVEILGEPSAKAKADGEPTAKPLGKMNHEELAVVVEAEQVDLGDASTKKEIVAAIEAARKAKAQGTSGD